MYMCTLNIKKCLITDCLGSENIQPELRDQLSYVTFFLNSLEGSLDTSLTVLINHIHKFFKKILLIFLQNAQVFNFPDLTPDLKTVLVIYEN
jgi:hypothetical protein